MRLGIEEPNAVEASRPPNYRLLPEMAASSSFYQMEPTMQINLSALATRFAKDESGAALLEYSILIGLITAGVIGFITGAGTWVSSKWSALATAGIH